MYREEEEEERKKKSSLGYLWKGFFSYFLLKFLIYLIYKTAK
jgi:hypothetical protein